MYAFGSGNWRRSVTFGYFRENVYFSLVQKLSDTRSFDSVAPIFVNGHCNTRRMSEYIYIYIHIYIHIIFFTEYAPVYKLYIELYIHTSGALGHATLGVADHRL